MASEGTTGAHGEGMPSERGSSPSAPWATGRPRRPPVAPLKSREASPPPVPGRARAEGTEDVASLPDRRLRDLKEGEGPVRIIARVVQSQRREVARKEDGSKRPVLSGLLTDGSATLRFSWWDPPAEEPEPQTVLRVANPQVRSWQGRTELSFGWKTQVEVASEMELPRLEDHEYLARTLSEIRPGEEGFRVVVRVLESSPRVLSVGERERVVRSGLLGDAGGRMPFVAWTDLGLERGQVVELFGGYVRTYQGRSQLVLNERSRAEPRAAADLPGARGLEDEPAARIGTLEEGGGGPFAVVEGHVVEVRDPSGLVFTCPSCSRSLSEGRCREHGEVAGSPELRARLVVDDGTGSLTAQLPAEAVEDLLGLRTSEAIAMARDRLDPAAVRSLLVDRTILRRLRFLGRAVPGDWGLTLFVDRVLPPPTGSLAGQTAAGGAPGKHAAGGA